MRVSEALSQLGQSSVITEVVPVGAAWREQLQRLTQETVAAVFPQGFNALWHGDVPQCRQKLDKTPASITLSQCCAAPE